jgi:hypothetical protein
MNRRIKYKLEVRILRANRPYKKSVYGNGTFCIHFIYEKIDSVYKFRIFNKQFIFEHFFEKTEKTNVYGMYTEKLIYTECIRNF